jgi:hypothetical protein
MSEMKAKEEKKNPKDIKSVIVEINKRYDKEEEDDPFFLVMREAIDTLEKRLSKLKNLIAVRENEGTPTGHLDIDLKVIDAQSHAFYMALTLYQDLKSLNRTEKFN